jgi:hypothetical protein
MHRDTDGNGICSENRLRLVLDRIFLVPFPGNLYPVVVSLSLLSASLASIPVILPSWIYGRWGADIAPSLSCTGSLKQHT